MGNKIMLCILTFFYIFGLKIIGPLDSTMLVGIILTLVLLFNLEYRRTFFGYMKRIKNYMLLFIVALLILWSFTVMILNQVADYSYLVTIFHLLFVLFVGVELSTYFKYKGYAGKIVDTILVCFLVQTAFQWIFLFSPDLSQSFNFLRGNSGTLELLQEHYSGRRGLALSGAGFFSLSSTYGVALLLYCSRFNTLFKNRIMIRVVLFFFLLTGTFFAGRTGFIALLFIPLLYLKNLGKVKRRGVIKVLITLLTCLLCVFVIFSLGEKNERIGHLYGYSFQLANNWFNNSEIGSTSTDTLIDMYNVDISFKTFIIGDAQYNIIDEYGHKSYYMKVDPGYLRKIFYFGVIGIILSFALQFLIYGDSFKKDRVFVLLFLFMALLELKGEIIGLNLMVNSVLVLAVVASSYLQNVSQGILKNNEEKK